MNFGRIGASLYNFQCSLVAAQVCSGHTSSWGAGEEGIASRRCPRYASGQMKRNPMPEATPRV